MKSPGHGGSTSSFGLAALRADARRGPRPLVLAALAQALQALLLAGLGVVTAVVGITDDSEDAVNAALVGALALGGGIAFLLVARGLLGARDWARSPALVWQLILIPIGFTTADDKPAVAYPLLASVLVVLGGMFAPASGAAMLDTPQSDEG